MNKKHIEMKGNFVYYCKNLDYPKSKICGFFALKTISNLSQTKQIDKTKHDYFSWINMAT